MTQYEKLSITISILAILISTFVPIGKFLWKKYVTKLSLNILVFDKLLLLFNESGAYFKMKFAIECNNHPTTIKNVKAKITRVENNETNIYEWSFLESTSMWLGIEPSSRTITSQYAGPIKLEANSLTPLYIEFSNENQKYCNDIKRGVNERDDSILALKKEFQLSGNFSDYESFQQEYRKKSSYNQLYALFSDKCYWKEGDYSLKIIITYGNNETYTKQYFFSISKEDSENLKQNIDEIIFGRIKQEYWLKPYLNIIYVKVKE